MTCKLLASLIITYRLRGSPAGVQPEVSNRVLFFVHGEAIFVLRRVVKEGAVLVLVIYVISWLERRSLRSAPSSDSRWWVTARGLMNRVLNPDIPSPQPMISTHPDYTLTGWPLTPKVDIDGIYSNPRNQNTTASASPSPRHVSQCSSWRCPPLCSFSPSPLRFHGRLKL